MRVAAALLAAAALWALPVAAPIPETSAAAVVYPTCEAGPAAVDGVPRFWTDDRTCYESPWFAGAHRLMIPFGCTAAPYYPRVAACAPRGGIHHGIDIDMPVGTRIFSNVNGAVVKGTVGTAYGAKAFLIRTSTRDYVLGHVGTVYVSNGQRVSAGQLIARSNDLGAPDGPHLHFEVRPRGGSYRDAVNPRAFLRLSPFEPAPRGCC